MDKICAIIPVHNEQQYICALIQKIKKYNIDIIVIDDGSTDQTRSITEKEVVFVLSHPNNQGKGAALRTGFSFALGRGYDFIITLDGDGQHNTDEIPLFIDRISNSDAGIVVGNRLHNPRNMPSSRLFVNRLFSRIVSAACRQHIPDALCGYRAIKKQVLKSITLSTNKFDIDPEVLIKAAKRGFKIDSVDIESIYGAESSHIRPWQDGYRFFCLIVEELKR